MGNKLPEWARTLRPACPAIAPDGKPCGNYLLPCRATDNGVHPGWDVNATPLAAPAPAPTDVQLALGQLKGILSQLRMQGLTMSVALYERLDVTDPADRRLISREYARMAGEAMGR